MSVCIRCGCGYVLLEDKNTCAPTTYDLIGCEVVSPNWVCKRPKAEYVMRTEITGIVIRYSNGSHCEIESTLLQCLQCHSGYKLDSNGYCIKHDKILLNEYYSYFYGDIIKSRLTTMAASDDGIFPTIKYCLSYAALDEASYQTCTSNYETCKKCVGSPCPKCDSSNRCFGKCVTCYSSMVPTEAIGTKNSCVVSPCDYCVKAK